MQKRILKTVACLFACVLLTLPSLCVSAEGADYEPPIAEHIGAAYLYNVENERVIYEYESEKQVFPAASVKIMTAVVAYEALSQRMDERVEITDAMVRGVTGNNIAIEAGEKILIRDLFYALLLKGANDAAYVLAHVCCGSPLDFVDAMNAKAAQLSMTSTHYTNPTGMHDDMMVTTAKDQAKIAGVFASYTQLLEMSSMSKHVIEKTSDCVTRNLYNRNAFVSKLNSLGTGDYYYKYAKGMNYGSTTEGGESLVTLGSRGGLSYICVILGGEESEEDEPIYVFNFARALLDYALDGFGYVEVLSTSRLVYDIPVELSEKADHVMLVPSESIKSYLCYNVDPERDLKYSYTLDRESLVAPVKEGTAVGHISVYDGDTLLGTVTLVTQNAVDLSAFLATLDKIQRFTESKFFICTVISLVVVTVAFVFINSFIRAKKQKRSRTIRYKR